jgi:hypothetical protein
MLLEVHFQKDTLLRSYSAKMALSEAVCAKTSWNRKHKDGPKTVTEGSCDSYALLPLTMKEMYLT